MSSYAQHLDAESDMAINFIGHKLHMICDDESDIDPSWDVGTSIYVNGSNRYYVMCSGGSCTGMNYGSYSNLTGTPTIPAAQLQSDWNESNNVLLDYIKNKPVIPSVARTTSSLTLSLVGSGATGTQISSTKDSTVRCAVSTSTTSTIGGPSTSLVTIKICATNSATEGNWTSVATFESDQTITLAIVLQSIQIVKGQLCADVPAGWFVKLVNSGTGTHAETYITGQQTIYG